MRLILALTLVALTPALVTSAPPPEGTFGETIEVRERSLLVEPVRGMKEFHGALGNRADEILLLDAGRPREVVRLEPLTRDRKDAEAWRVLLWFSAPGEVQERLRHAALALAARAPELVALGEVEVVVADPQPRSILSPSREAGALATALGELARAWTAPQPARRQGGTGDAIAAASAGETGGRQVSRLVAALTSEEGAAPRALFWVGSSGLSGAEELEGLSRALAGEAPQAPSPVRAWANAVRALPAYGWVVLPISLRTESEPPPPPAGSAYDNWRNELLGPQRFLIPILSWSWPRRQSAVNQAEIAALHSEPQLAPLAALSAASAGTLIGYESQLAPAIERLRGLWRLWFRTPVEKPGELRGVEVFVDGGELRLAAPVWIREGTPPEVLEARRLAQDADLP